MKKDKELLFSVTKKDFIVEPFKDSGAGGQHRNKTMSCVRIRHPESGAEAVGTEHREQSKNKKLAFQRIYKSKKFLLWCDIKAAEIMGNETIEEKAEKATTKAMKPENLKIEYGESFE
jgi:peptide chain release factor 1|tara:strand:+ start:11482 stop:11835 length:354 start_codon:yes stop_codon:yes gene_type:complete